MNQEEKILEFDKINDSLNRVKDVSDVGHWGTGNCKIQINEIDEVHYFMELFKQSYDEKIWEDINNYRLNSKKIKFMRLI